MFFSSFDHELLHFTRLSTVEHIRQFWFTNIMARSLACDYVQYWEKRKNKPGTCYLTTDKRRERESYIYIMCKFELKNLVSFQIQKLLTNFLRCFTDCHTIFGVLKCSANFILPHTKNKDVFKMN